MASDASKDLAAELRAPGVVSVQEVGDALKAFRPVLNRISQQAARLQERLAVAEIDEDDQAIAQKFGSLDQTLDSMQRQHDKAARELRALWSILRRFQDEAEDVCRKING